MDDTSSPKRLSIDGQALRSNTMGEPREVEVPARSLSQLAHLLGTRRSRPLQEAAESIRRALGNRRVWNVNSTAVGGGVAEMLQVLVGYGLDAGLDTHWVVMAGDANFFAITKRLHNRLHGVPGDDGELGRHELDHYCAVSRDNVRGLNQWIRPGDVVILHDPQTAGMAGPLVRRGARVVWRCHIGTDHSNERTREAWAFLLPHLADCTSFVFSKASFVPPELSRRDVWIIEPSIDPLSPKNRPMHRSRVLDTLAQVGLLIGESATSAGSVVGNAGPLLPSDALIVQVSRWDRLKDMLGVLQGFAEHVAGRSEACLALVGPSVDDVTDDPEGAHILAECLGAWEALPRLTRERVRLVAVPMRDRVNNALIINAVQRHASVVVQKSIQEGFGLTVAESMWKSRPVVASAVGGIVDQVPPGTGLLLDDPHDLDAFGRTLVNLLAQPTEMDRLGRRARQHVRTHLMTDRHLIDYARLLQQVSEG